VRELLGIASGKDNAWYTLRIGELKSILAQEHERDPTQYYGTLVKIYGHVH